MKYFVILLLIPLALSACASVNTSDTPSPTVTLLPAFIATPQSAEANARATSAAVASLLDSMRPTQTALAMAATQSQATQAAAAEQTATARADIATATAQSWEQQTAIAGQTKAAYQQSVSATQTQAVLNEIIRQDVAAQNVLWFNTWAWRAATLLVFALCFVAAALTVTTSWQHRQWILTRLGIIRWGPDGKPYWTAPTSDGGVVIVDAARSFGPGIVVSPRGQVITSGMAENPMLQDRTTARAQAADLLLAAGPAHTAIDHRTSVRAAAQLAAPATNIPSLPAPNYQIVPSVQALPPELAAPTPDTLEILDAEWRSDEEN